MYKVYYQDSLILFSDKEVPGYGTNGPLPEDFGITNMVEKLRNCKYLSFVSDDPRKEFERFRSAFRQVEAAGGLVGDGSGRALMIFRNGRWDLPKGHVEEGESFEECALREVREETGVLRLETLSLLAETFHFYELNGEWILKGTHWFLMKGTGDNFSPQEEEGIHEVRWVGQDALAAISEDSFASVKEVINQYMQNQEN